MPTAPPKHLRGSGRAAPAGSGPARLSSVWRRKAEKSPWRLHVALLTLLLADLVHHVDHLVGADLVVAVLVEDLELPHCLGAGVHIVEVHGG